jgi:glc operon protein GlcG
MNRRLCLLVLAAVAALPAAHLANKKALTLDGAKAIAAAAEAHAKKNNWNVVITILDDGGNLVYLQRMDGTQIGSIDVAIRKAEAAIKFKRSTKVFSDGVGSRPALLGLPGSIAIEGGLPIEADGQILGSIGVSGVTSEQDGEIAAAGLAGLRK